MLPTGSPDGDPSVPNVGQKFGLLTLVGRAPGRTSGGKTLWYCDCECGVRGHIVSSDKLKTTKSCGCLRKRRTARRGEALTQARLKELVFYDPETGEFIWRVCVAKCVQIGDRAGCVNATHGYWIIRIDSKGYRAHRLAWLYEFGHFPTGDLDHKNRNRSDNRIINLRLANRNQNPANQKLSQANSSGFKGVSWKKQDKKYVARIGFRGEVVHLRYCNTAEEAARVYDYAAARVFGEFALTNKQLGLLGMAD